MKRAYKYKIKPTFKQQEQLNKAFGCTRFIYNWGLDKKTKAWQENKKQISYFELAKELTILKKTEGYEWLKDVSNESLQQSLRCLDNAYTQFFKAKKGFPRFKSKKHSRDVSKYILAVYFDFNNWKVKIPKCGWVKLCKNKTFDTNYKLGTLTVSKDKCGEFWCSIIVEDNKPLKSKAKISEETSVGIDLGIKDYAILSDGTKYTNPKFLENGQNKLKKLFKKFARTDKNSKRHEVIRLKIARQYKKITNRRVNFLHKLSTDIIKRYDTICLENLNIKGMMSNHCLANSIQSVTWFEFVRQLNYKSEWYGKNVVVIGRFEPSSKTCSKCGYVKRDLKLSDREWICPVCGEYHDRDVNAAINIKNFALNPQALVGNEIKIGDIF
jgi:putative transposase